jgi:hypothetical protein
LRVNRPLPTALARAFAFALALVLTGCGPTLVHTPLGWKVNGAAYIIDPDAHGRVMPEGWILSNYETAGDGFRKDSVDDPRDLAMKRNEDDGILILATESISSEDEGKKLEVLAERWLQRVVMNPEDGEDKVFEGIAPPLTTTVHLQSGLTFGTGHTTHGRNVDVTRRGEFAVRNGTGFELEANLVPGGATGPDRALYLGFVRSMSSGRLVVIAYANTPSMFASGTADASGLAHRVHF